VSCECNSRAGKRNALADEQSALRNFISAVPAELARGPHHTVTRDVGTVRPAHDRADCPRGTWLSSEGGNIAVRGDAPFGDPPNNRENAGCERRL
jgi:hypothetical protein